MKAVDRDETGEELRNLLLNAGWVKCVLEEAVLRFKDALASLQKQRREVTSGERSVRDVLNKGSMCGAELLMKLLKLSLKYYNEGDEVN